MLAVTACYSRNPCRPYDQPKHPPPGVEVAYAFTDDPLWYDAGWQRPPHERNNLLLHPRMRGKAPKAAPHLFGFGDDVLWIDSSMVSTGRDVRSLRDLVPAGGVGCFTHRFRSCIFEEADASVEDGFTRYSREPIRSQASHYRAQGHPTKSGLFELGTIMWRGAQRTIGAHWLAEMLAWTAQDQLSWPYVCRAHGVLPTTLPGTAVENEWFVYRDHQGEE